MDEQIKKIASMLTDDPNIINEAKDDWPKSEELEEGSFTKWCKDNGHAKANLACAKHAWKVAKRTGNKELRGKVSFYMNTVKPEGKTLSAIAGDDEN